jgi:expansin (peptidoglycan-binding protein)
MKNRKYFLALTLSLLSFVLMFSCTKRSDKDEDEKTQTQENVNSNTEIANSENPNSETPQSENPAAEDSNGTAAGDDSKGGSSTSPKIDETVANSEAAKELALDKVHNATNVIASSVSSEGGKCGLDGFTGNFSYASINEEDYNNGLMAGAYLKVTGPKGTIGVVVTNIIGGEKGTLGLSQDDLNKIYDATEGGKVTWKVAALPTEEPVSFKYGEGSSEGYFKIQVRNHRYPIAKLEVKRNGKYIELPRQDYNYFVKEGGLGAGPYTIRLTDVFGHVIEETIPLETDPNKIVTGKNNFPN